MSLKISARVWELSIPTTAKLVLLRLAHHAHDDGGSVYPSVAHIAKKTGVSERQIQRYLRDFERSRILTVEGNETGGRGRARVYRFIFESGDMGDTLSTTDEVSPNTHKGDAHNRKRVTPTAIKGDTDVTPIVKERSVNGQGPIADAIGNSGAVAPSTPSPTKRRRTTPSEIDPDFRPDPRMIAKVRDELRLSPEEIDYFLVMFRDCFLANGGERRNWTAAWWSWMRANASSTTRYSAFRKARKGAHYGD